MPTSITPSVALYTLHIEEAGYIRAAITAMKAQLDNPDLRQKLISLNSVEANLTNLVFPLDLTGRIQTLSEALRGLETTLSMIEDGIRGTVLYPRQE